MIINKIINLRMNILEFKKINLKNNNIEYFITFLKTKIIFKNNIIIIFFRYRYENKYYI